MHRAYCRPCELFLYRKSTPDWHLGGVSRGRYHKLTMPSPTLCPRTLASQCQTCIKTKACGFKRDFTIPRLYRTGVIASNRVPDTCGRRGVPSLQDVRRLTLTHLPCRTRSLDVRASFFQKLSIYLPKLEACSGAALVESPIYPLQGSAVLVP